MLSITAADIAAAAIAIVYFIFNTCHYYYIFKNFYSLFDIIAQLQREYSKINYAILIKIKNFLKNILTKRNFGIIMCSQQRSKIVKVKKQSKPI